MIRATLLLIAATLVAMALPHLVFGAPNPPLNSSIVCTNTAAISQTANTKIISGVAGQKIYICSVLLISAGLQNVSLVEGTGGTCGTNQQALIGAITTPSVQIATSSGFSSIASTPWLPEITAGDDICLLQSAGQNVSGTITYIQQ